MARYAPGQPPYTEDINQLERYLRVEHEQVRGSTDDIYTLARFCLDNFVSESYLSLNNATPDAITLSAGWTTIAWDAFGPTNNKAAYPALPNGMNFTESATWRMSVVMSMTFTEVNAGRSLKVRLYNTTTAAPVGGELVFGVGRDTPGFTVSASWLAQVDVGLLTQNVQLQISAPDAFSNVFINEATWSVNNVARYQGNDPITSLEKQGK